MKLNKKQTIALDFLEDDITEEVVFGGSAGPGKSTLGCYWQLKNRIRYPGSRGFIGRAIMKTLKDTTLKTLFAVAKAQGLRRGTHFDLTSAQDKENPNCVTFCNGSLIFLRDLFAYPSDPDFDELGSLEITDAFVDECGQVTQIAKDTLKTRIRYGLDQWNLKPKLLFATNPVKDWPYREFYKPAREGTLLQHRQFVPALVTDNPDISPAYIKSLDKLPEGAQKERLRYGNWEYDDDPAALMSYEKILQCFMPRELTGHGKYITADIARYGKDNTVIGVWNGPRVRLYYYHGLSIPQSAAKINQFRERFGIPMDSVIVDEDGIGSGVVDILKCKGFINNSTPLPAPSSPTMDRTGNVKNENFSNLKSQCYFRLADRINAGDLIIECEEGIKQKVIEELEQVKQYNMDKDMKKQIIPKDKVKEILGRSPDFSDTLMMREWFSLSPQFVVAVA